MNSLKQDAHAREHSNETREVPGNIRMLGMSLEELELIMSTEALPQIPNSNASTTANKRFI